MTKANVKFTKDNDSEPLLDKLQKENKQLKDNWNKLKEYAKENLYFYSGYQGEDLETDVAIQGVLDKMQELEKGDGVNE